jgi:hypothetical protein
VWTFRCTTAGGAAEKEDFNAGVQAHAGACEHLDFNLGVQAQAGKREHFDLDTLHVIQHLLATGDPEDIVKLKDLDVLNADADVHACPSLQ